MRPYLILLDDIRNWTISSSRAIVKICNIENSQLNMELKNWNQENTKIFKVMLTVFVTFVNELAISSNCSSVVDDTSGICLSTLSVSRYKFVCGMLNDCETWYWVCFLMTTALVAPINVEVLIGVYSDYFTNFLGVFAVKI